MLQNNNNNNTLFPKQIQLIGLYNIYNMLIVPTTYFTYIPILNANIDK